MGVGMSQMYASLQTGVLRAVLVWVCFLIVFVLPTPALARTDRDGWSDANSGATSGEDFQYDRPVPSYVKLYGAARDVPISYQDGCHVGPTEHTFRHCVYGDASSSFSVALFGDSHAEQWLPGLIRAATARHWRVDTLTRSACASADIRSYNKLLGHMDWDCVHFRHHALAWMADHPPDIVLMSNLGLYVPRDPSGQPYPPSEREAQWRAGLARTFDALPSSSRAILLEDTPYPGVEVPACLKAHRQSIAACVRPRTKVVKSAHAASEKQAADESGAIFANLTDQMCPVDQCPVLLDQIVLYRDHSHISATYSRALAPSLGAILDAARAAPTIRQRVSRTAT